jgi:hypothetical protein
MKKIERTKHIDQWLQSGQSKKDYCAQAGINYSTFIYWFKNQDSTCPGNFVKLEKSISPIHSAPLEILLPNGIRIYSDQPITIELLKSLHGV